MIRKQYNCKLFGYSYHGDLSNFIDWTIYFYGSYERSILSLLADAARVRGPGSVFLDIGANVGQHSLFMAGQGVHVHAFEPWEVARSRLERALAENAIKNVSVHPFGLGDEDANLLFHAPASANLGSGSFVAGVNLNASTGVLPVRQGDKALGELGVERVDVIKIDTEGFEIRVLRGLADTLKRFRPVVVCELSATTLAELGSEPVTALREIFGLDWLFLDPGNHPERYRLRPFRPCGTAGTLLAVPETMAGMLAKRGG